MLKSGDAKSILGFIGRLLVESGIAGDLGMLIAVSAVSLIIGISVIVIIARIVRRRR